MKDRKSGILLHITSLPGKEGIGTMGVEAFRFIDLLNGMGQSYWQILPLGPVGYGNSPYQCYSAFAGNPLLIDMQLLLNDGLLNEGDFEGVPSFSEQRVLFEKVNDWKYPILRKAYKNFRSSNYESFSGEYHQFLDENSWWLNDYSLFMAAKLHFKEVPWHDWNDAIKFRNENELQDLNQKLGSEIDFQKFLQFFFFRQWYNLKQHANSKGIEIIGDVPLYVSADSADVWANSDIFLLDEQLNPLEVGGVPPDYFSETGQLWGNPVFNWERLEERKFDWWLARLHFNLKMFDEVRIDHFRGLESFWSVPADETTAINGKWLPAKGHEMLQLLKDQIGDLPLIAEDLGIITPEVEKLRDDFQLPGMKVLQFAYGSDAANKDLPHNYNDNFAAYTGTHDNDTTLGWLQGATGEEEKRIRKYLGRWKRKALRKAIEQIWSSPAKLALIPMQDFLNLNRKSRMNIPGTASGNWEWRFSWGQVRPKQVNFLKEITEKYNR